NLNLIKPPSIVAFYQTKNTDLFDRLILKLLTWIFSVRCWMCDVPLLLENDKRQHIPPIHAFGAPVDDLLRLIQDRIRSTFHMLAGGAATFPVHQRSSTTDPDHLPHHILRV